MTEKQNMKKGAFSFFPNPANGETIYSIFCRITARSGLPGEYVISRLTEQRRLNSFLSALPGYIDLISKSTPYGHIWNDSMKIVCDHTALPYFTYFLPKHERQEWISKLAVQKFSHPIAMALGLSMFPTPAAPPHPRYCPQCAVSQIQEFGFSFYRRHHQLPGVLVCKEHKEILSHGCNVCGTYPIKNSGLCMPGRCQCEISTPLPVLSAVTDIEPLIWVARESEYMVTSTGTGHSDPRAVLKEMAIQNGFGRGATIDYSKLAAGIENRYGQELLQLLDVQVCVDNTPAAWLKRLLQGTGSDKKKPSIQLLLVVGALFNTVKDFEEFGECKRPISKNLNQKPEKLRGLKTLINKKYSIADLVKHYGVGYGTVIRGIRQLGLRLPLSNRMKIKLGPTLEFIRKDLTAGIPKSTIMKHYCCSEETIILIELDQPPLVDAHRQSAMSIVREKHRSALLEFMKQFPDSGRSKIMTELPSCYDYLMRADKEWFYRQIPNRKKAEQPKLRGTRIEWYLVDEQKSHELEQVVAQLYSCDAKPIWVTKNGLLKRIGLQSKYHANPGKFPKVEGILARSAESYEDFVSRRRISRN